SALSLGIEVGAHAVAEDLEKQRDGALFEGQPQRSEGSPERPPRARLILGKLDTERAPNEVGDQRVGLATFVRAAARRRTPDGVRKRRQELANKARLADPWLGVQVRELAGAGGGAPEKRGQPFELLGAADERGACIRSRLELTTDDAIRRYRSRLSFQRERCDRLEEEPFARELIGALADEDVPGRGGAFDPLRGVDRVSGHRVGQNVAWQKPSDDFPGVDPDAHSEFYPDLERCACVYAGCGRSGRMRRLGRDATAADEPIRPRRWGTGSRREEGSGLETKPAPGQIEGCLAREDLIGGRRMFEPLRELHRFPEQRLARPRAQDRPGVDADPERQADVVPLL